MNIKVFRTIVGDDVIAEVLDEDKNYYLILNPIQIFDPVDYPQQLISRFAKYNDSDMPVMLFTHAIATVALPNKVAARQYIKIIEQYKEYVASLNKESDGLGEAAIVPSEDATEEEKTKNELYNNILKFVKPEGKSN